MNNNRRVGEHRLRTRITAITQAKLLRELTTGPSSYKTLVHATGLGMSTLSAFINALRNERLVRIGGWEPDSRGWMRVPQFEWAPDEPDAAPQRKGNGERGARYRAKLKQRRMQDALVKVS